MPGALPGAEAVVTEVNTVTILELKVQQKVGVAADSTKGPRQITDVSGQCFQHGKFEVYEQPHGMVQGGLKSTCIPPSLNIETGFLELN